MKPAGSVLRKGDWLVREVSRHGEAVAFIEREHYSHGAPNTAVYRHGLYSRGELLAGLFLGPLRGVALWIPPTRTAAQATFPGNWRGVLALSRFAVSPDLPTNAASFLLASSMRLIDRNRWPCLVTYADTAQGHTGSIYRATNWKESGSIPVSRNWVNSDGVIRGRKRGGVTLTASEMRRAGFTQSLPAPKIKFVHIAA